MLSVYKLRAVGERASAHLPWLDNGCDETLPFAVYVIVAHELVMFGLAVTTGRIDGPAVA